MGHGSTQTDVAVSGVSTDEGTCEERGPGWRGEGLNRGDSNARDLLRQVIE